VKYIQIQDTTGTSKATLIIADSLAFELVQVSLNLHFLSLVSGFVNG
jgi:hypothetical protein